MKASELTPSTEQAFSKYHALNEVMNKQIPVKQNLQSSILVMTS